jgi:four helix bundle protein
MNTETKHIKRYDLEERTQTFAKHVRQFIKILPKNIAHIEDSKQVIRSSGSIGANYIEANEALSKKDFLHRIRIARKEAKETVYWLSLFELDEKLSTTQKELAGEATELMKILSAIIVKSDR